MTARGRFSAGFDNSTASSLRFPRQLGRFAAQESVKQILQAGVCEKPLIWWADGPAGVSLKVGHSQFRGVQSGQVDPHTR